MKHQEGYADILVGVIAGTPVDTGMGVRLMLANGFRAIGDDISADPVANSALQVRGGSAFQDLIAGKIDRLAGESGVQAICIYCNSISTALDLDSLRRKAAVPVVTPLEVYEDIARSHSRIGVLGANCQAVAGIEKAVLAINARAEVIGVGVLPLVAAIEAGRSPEDIVSQLGIEGLTRFLRLSGAEVLVLGCTHFPYIRHVLDSISEIPVFDPADGMLAALACIARAAEGPGRLGCHGRSQRLGRRES